MDERSKTIILLVLIAAIAVAGTFAFVSRPIGKSTELPLFLKTEQEAATDVVEGLRDFGKVLAQEGHQLQIWTIAAALASTRPLAASAVLVTRWNSQKYCMALVDIQDDEFMKTGTNGLTTGQKRLVYQGIGQKSFSARLFVQKKEYQLFGVDQTFAQAYNIPADTRIALC